MELNDLLAFAAGGSPPQHFGGRVSLDKEILTDAARAEFASLLGTLSAKDFWTASVTQNNYIPKEGLWAPQRCAVGLSLAYMAVRRTSLDTSGAALVKMPTGTGKTGVIATLACAVPGIKRTLVITPRRALVDQMVIDLHTRLWSRFGLIYSGDEVRARNDGDPAVSERVPGGPVWRMLPSDAAKLAALTDERIVIVGTFAALEQILRPDRPAHRLTGRRPVGVDAIPPDLNDDTSIDENARTELVKLLRSFDLVIVDESHYEPAFIWSQCIRSLGRPTILFSATPYRNDFRYFDIDGRFAFNLSYAEARDRRLIRDVEILTSDPHAPVGETFAQRLLRFAKRVGDSTSPGEPERARVIVRAETYDSLVALREELRVLGEPSVLIHHKERRNNPASLRFKSVTNAMAAPQTESVRFWLHQWKLLEGVDNDRFGGVAVLEPFSTSRAVVQQIGRVLRYGRRDRTETALVIGANDLSEDLAERFERYKGYEARFDADPSEALRRETQFFETLRAASPAVQYISGDFRDRFDIDDEQVTFQDIQLPRRAYVMQNVKGWTLDEIAGASMLAMGLEDRHDINLLKPSVGAVFENVRLIAYVAWGNSPLLTRRSMPTWKLGVMALTQVDKRIFLLDTEGIVIDPEKLGLEAEQPSSLQRLVPTARPGETSRVTVASAVSLDISDIGVRAVTARMRDFGTGFFDLAQAMQATTSVRASLRNPEGVLTSRYLSLQRASVSDGSGQYVSVEGYTKWVAEVAAGLDSAVAPSPAFKRFAQATSAPPAEKAVPLNVLFDFVDLIGEEGEDAPALWNPSVAAALAVADRCLDVAPDGTFTIDVGGVPFSGKLKYEITGSLHRRGRYIVDCPELDVHLVGHAANRKEKVQLLSGMLSKEQTFRVIPADASLIYAQKHFYHPGMAIDQIAKDEPGGPLEHVVASPWLATVSSEKGKASWGVSDWVSNSVFGGVYAQFGLAGHGAADTGYIDTIRCKDGKLANLLDEFSLIVCDDGGTETCDFLCVDDDRQRVALIHAKVDDTTLSLTSLQAVGRQAQASLAFLTTIQSLPDRTSLWAKPVTIDDGVIASRVIKGADPVDKLWERARDAVRSARYIKEIWIMAGRILERKALLDELAKPEPSPRVRQMIYYIASLQTSAARANVSLKIYCSP